MRLADIGDATPLEVLDACLSNLDEAQAHGAFVVIDEDGARRAAEALPRHPRGPLHGIPVAVKDLIDVAGLPTALGRAQGPRGGARRRDRRPPAGGRAR